MYHAELKPLETTFSAEFSTNGPFSASGFDTRVVTVEKDYTGLFNKPSINGVILEGDLLSEDLGIDRTYVFEQTVASAEWDITHNLGKRPSVTIVDSAGTVVVGDIRYLSDDRVILSFAGAFSGTAYLN